MAEMSWARLPEAMSTVRWVSSQASAGIGSVFTVAPSTRMPTFASVGSELTSEVSDLRAASIVGVPVPSSEAIEPEASRTTASSSPCRSCTAAPRRGCCATTARCRRPGCCRPSANCSRPSTLSTRQGSSTATEARRHPAAPGLRAGHRPLGLRHGGTHRGAPARAGDPGDRHARPRVPRGQVRGGPRTRPGPVRGGRRPHRAAHGARPGQDGPALVPDRFAGTPLGTFMAHRLADVPRRTASAAQAWQELAAVVPAPAVDEPVEVFDQIGPLLGVGRAPARGQERRRGAPRAGPGRRRRRDRGQPPAGPRADQPLARPVVRSPRMGDRRHGPARARLARPRRGPCSRRAGPGRSRRARSRCVGPGRPGRSGPRRLRRGAEPRARGLPAGGRGRCAVHPRGGRPDPGRGTARCRDLLQIGVEWLAWSLPRKSACSRPLSTGPAVRCVQAVRAGAGAEPVRAGPPARHFGAHALPAHQRPPHQDREPRRRGPPDPDGLARGRGEDGAAHRRGRHRPRGRRGLRDPRRDAHQEPAEDDREPGAGSSSVRRPQPRTTCAPPSSSVRSAPRSPNCSRSSARNGSTGRRPSSAPAGSPERPPRRLEQAERCSQNSSPERPPLGPRPAGGLGSAP